MTTKKTKEPSQLEDELLLNVEKKFETDEPRIYEIGYVIIPSVAEDVLPGEVTKIKDIIGAKNAVVISEEYPKSIPLAYTMVKVIENKHTKFSTGYFGWVKFEILPMHVNAIKVALDNNASILRYLLIQTVRENTIIGKRVMTRHPRRKKEGGEGEEGAVKAPELSPEEIDQSIAKIVIE